MIAHGSRIDSYAAGLGGEFSIIDDSIWIGHSAGTLVYLSFSSRWYLNIAPTVINSAILSFSNDGPAQALTVTVAMHATANAAAPAFAEDIQGGFPVVGGVVVPVADWSDVSIDVTSQLNDLLDYVSPITGQAFGVIQFLIRSSVPGVYTMLDAPLTVFDPALVVDYDGITGIVPTHKIGSLLFGW